MSRAVVGAPSRPVPLLSTAGHSSGLGDVEIERLVQDLRVAVLTEGEAWKEVASNDAPDSPERRFATECLAASAALRERIASVPASGVPGFVAKATALGWAVGEGIQDGSEERLAESLIADAARLFPAGELSR